MTGLTKLLVANRGEIAVRVMRTARALGYRTVAVYSEADAGAPHVRLADQAVPIGPPPARRSYLDIERIIDAAKTAGADAIHPGYGFLAENADFAEACAAAAITFVGPSPAAIRLMGDKAAAKARMIDAGIPCVPGYHGDDQRDATLAAEAARIGYPVMIKAAVGGGGRGMRLVVEGQAFASALATARSEAESAFGVGRLILEKAVVRPRHVEIQVFADALGNVVHLGERDCSIQRRHQKVIEEAPAPGLSDEVRQAMGRAAVAAASAIDYVGAGTVEFLLDGAETYYFLEMNTRLQVEHPVTEMVTGFDLVEWQLGVAAGAPLPVEQDRITVTGHAIEARLYAEDPSVGFLPQSGRAVAWRPAAGGHVRVDHGFAAGQEIGPHYDPLIAKFIAHGASREEARRRLILALEDSVILGLTTNRRFLGQVLAHAAFVAGGADTGFIAEHFPPAALAPPAPEPRLAALAAVLLHQSGEPSGQPIVADWASTGARAAPMRLEPGDGPIDVTVTARGGGAFDVDLDGKVVTVGGIERSDHRVRFLADGLQETAHVAFADDGALLVDLRGTAICFRDTLLAAGRVGGGPADGEVLAPMHGRILAVDAKPGDRVSRGQRLVVLEAMKIEHEIAADLDGTVDDVAVAVGDQVAARSVLIRLSPVDTD